MRHPRLHHTITGRRHLGVALLLGLVLALWLVPAAALERRTGETASLPPDQTVDDDLLIASNAVTVAGHVTGDLYAFGNTVTLLPTARIDGDVIAAGNLVTLAGTIGGDVRTAGNIVNLDAAVSHNVLAAGNQLTLGAVTTVKGNVIGGGNMLTILGAIDGSLTGGASYAQLNGKIGRNAELWVESLAVQSAASIGGRLTYTAPIVQTIPTTAVRGPVQWLKTPQPPPAPEPTGVERGLAALGGLFSLLWLSGTILFGLLLVWLTPGLYQTTTTIVRQRGLLALVSGLATLVLAPVVVVLLLISVVGLPVGLLGVGAYLAGWYLGWLVAAPAVTGLVIGLFRGGQTRLAVGWLLVIGLIALHLLTRLPYLGGLLAAAVLCLGLGALVLAITDRLHRPAPAQPSPPAFAAPAAPRPAPSA